MTEQRQKQRVRPGLGDPVEIQIMGTDFLDIFLARDVSETGMGIEVPYKFEGCDIDHPIELIITLPPDNCFKASGIIRHSDVKLSKQGIFGVEFISIQHGHENDIKIYINEMLKTGKVS